jgi:hypothetical protein
MQTTRFNNETLIQIDLINRHTPGISTEDSLLPAAEKLIL